MHINDNDKRRDSLIGEAVLEILEEKSFITNTLLIAKLQKFLFSAVESLRKEAIENAIKMLMASESPYK